MITSVRTTLIKHFFGWLARADSQLSKSVPNLLVRQSSCSSAQLLYQVMQEGDVSESKLGCGDVTFLYIYNNQTDCRQTELHRPFCFYKYTKCIKYFRAGRVLSNYIVMKSFAQKIAHTDNYDI
jgi:hypothetical protein